MGIRIHKIVGYGWRARNKSEEKAIGELYDWFIDVPRPVIQQGSLTSYDFEKVLDLVKWEYSSETTRGNAMATLQRHLQFHDLPSPVCKFFDVGDKGCIIFTVPGQDAWHRFDDTIDYYEGKGGCKNQFQRLHVGGIYPYDGPMKRMRGKPAAHDSEIVGKGAGQYNQVIGKWCPTLPPLLSGPALRDAINNFRPALPPLLLLWFALQDIPEQQLRGYLNHLRPSLGVSWS